MSCELSRPSWEGAEHEVLAAANRNIAPIFRASFGDRILRNGAGTETEKWTFGELSDWMAA